MQRAWHQCSSVSPRAAPSPNHPSQSNCSITSQPSSIQLSPTHPTPSNSTQSNLPQSGNLSIPTYSNHSPLSSVVVDMWSNSFSLSSLLRLGSYPAEAEKLETTFSQTALNYSLRCDAFTRCHEFPVRQFIQKCFKWTARQGLRYPTIFAIILVIFQNMQN